MYLYIIIIPSLNIYIYIYYIGNWKFYWIKVHLVHNGEQTVLETITKKNQREKRAKCSHKYATTQTKSQLAKTSKDQQISQHPQMCEYFVPSKLATSNKLVPYSKWFVHEKRRGATVLGITHWIPNIRSIYI